jgi:hypothetical protein
MREVVVSALFRPYAIVVVVGVVLVGDVLVGEILDGERDGVRRQHPASAPYGDDRITAEESAHADQDAVASPFAQLGESRLPGEFPPPDNAPMVGDEHFEDSPLLSALMREG